MIHARKQHPAFGLGDFLDLGGSNPTVLSYVASTPPPTAAPT